MGCWKVLLTGTRLMIDFMVLSSEWQLYVLDTGTKRVSDQLITTRWRVGSRGGSWRASVGPDIARVITCIQGEDPKRTMVHSSIVKADDWSCGWKVIKP